MLARAITDEGGTGRSRHAWMKARPPASRKFGARVLRNERRCQIRDALIARTGLRRHLTGDPPELGARAAAYLRAESDLLLTDLVATETVDVLNSFFEAPREQVAQALRSLIGFDSIVCVDPALLVRGAEVSETERIDFAEAYLVARSASIGVDRVASFDRPIDRVDTDERMEPSRASVA